MKGDEGLFGVLLGNVEAGELLAVVDEVVLMNFWGCLSCSANSISTSGGGGAIFGFRMAAYCWGVVVACIAKSGILT